MDLGFKEWVKEFLERNLEKRDSTLVAAIITIAFWLIFLIIPKSFYAFMKSWLGEFINKVPSPVYVVVIITTVLISWIWVKSLKKRLSSLSKSNEIIRKKLQTLKVQPKSESRLIATFFDAVGNDQFKYQINVPNGLDISVNQSRIEKEIHCKPCAIALEPKSEYRSYSLYKWWECPACKETISDANGKTLWARTKSSFIKTLNNAQ